MSTPLPPKPGVSPTPQVPPAPPKPVLPPKGLTLSTNAPSVTLPKAPSSGDSSTTSVIIPGQAAAGPSPAPDKTADLKLPVKPAAPVAPAKGTPPVSTPVATAPAAPKAPTSSLPAKPGTASLPAKPAAPAAAAATRPQSAARAPMLDDEPKTDYVSLVLAILVNGLAWGASAYFYHFMPSQ